MNAQTALVDALRLKLSLRGALDPDVEEMILRLRGMAELRDEEHAKKQRKFTRSDTPRLDAAIRKVLEASPGEWPTSFAVCQALEREQHFEPMPSPGHVEDRLRLIRGKRKSGPNAVRTGFKPDSVEQAPSDCNTLQSAEGVHDMSALPTVYRIAFAEAAQHRSEFPGLLEQLTHLEQRLAERQPKPSAPTQEDVKWAS